jgi:hypothetical protein
LFVTAAVDIVVLTMHGVKKFKGTAEAEAAKREQTRQKVMMYSSLLDQCNHKVATTTTTIVVVVGI